MSPTVPARLDIRIRSAAGLHLYRAVTRRHRLYSNLSAAPGLSSASTAEPSSVIVSLPPVTVPVGSTHK
ncbi:MAG TPA: hypothetical protein VNC42_11620 [Bradyrhizobium sp.]|nr:hypothetical protein [Bradyrhizobium sp.]